MKNNYDDIIKKLQLLKVNVLLKDYRKNLIGNLYIDIPEMKTSGYAGEMIHYNRLHYLNFDATVCVAPFFGNNDSVVRGLIFDEFENSNMHSWIEFKSFNKDYVFDPALNIIVLAKDYQNAFATYEVGKISTLQIKNDLIEILNNGIKTEDGFRVVPTSYNVGDSFYKTNMEIQGTVIKKHILMMRSRIKKCSIQ